MKLTCRWTAERWPNLGQQPNDAIDSPERLVKQLCMLDVLLGNCPELLSAWLLLACCHCHEQAARPYQAAPGALTLVVFMRCLGLAAACCFCVTQQPLQQQSALHRKLGWRYLLNA